MATTPINLGPWSGVDNFHDQDANAFQLPGENDPRRPALVQALDVDMDDDGWPSSRQSLVASTPVSDGDSIFSGAGLLLVQAGGEINRVDPSDWSMTPLVSGLPADTPVSFHEHAGQLFWTNGIQTGRILQDGSALNWGCAVAPVPTLGTAAGSLRAGRYMVAVAFVDASGIVHGANEAAVIDLDGAQSITVDVSPIDPRATSIKIFASKANNKGLFLVGIVLVGSLPVQIDDVEVSEEPIRTQYLSPPVPGDGLFSHRGMLVIFAEQYLFPSYGDNSHLYEVADIIAGRPSSILAGAGLDDGFWTLCETGAFWTAGGRPENWQTWQRDSRKYAAGALVIDGNLLPALKVEQNIALFVSEHGVVAGLPGGILRPLHQDRLRLDVVGKRASIIYHEANGIRQFLFTLSD